MDWNTTGGVWSRLRDGARIMAFLEAVKGQTVFALEALPPNVASPPFLEKLAEAGLIHPTSKQEGQMWQLSATAKVRLAMRALELGQPERPVLGALTWREFEEFTAAIFDAHGFLTRHPFRFSTERRRFEIDVAAARLPYIFCADCKHFGVRPGKASSLRAAAEAQIGRVEALASHFPSHQASLGCLHWKTAMLIPLLVTLLHEELVFHSGVPVVPAALLNTFLLTFHEHLDELTVIHPPPGRQSTLI